MKNCYLTILAFLCCFSSNFALDSSISFATFKNGESGGYAEIYFHIVGRSNTFVPVNEDSTLWQSAVEVIVLFKKGERIVKYDKFQLNSPKSETIIDFLDLKRYALENGRYDLEVIVEDVNKKGNTSEFKESIRVNYSDYRLQQSDIQLLASYRPAEEGEENVMVKNGYFLASQPFQFYGKNAENLIFYNEIYNADKDIGDDFMVSYIIERVKGNGDTENILTNHKRKKPTPVNILLQKLDITSLPSGNYNFVIEVKDRNKARLSKKSIFFQRSNPSLNPVEEEAEVSTGFDDAFISKLSDEELEYSLRAVAPLLNDSDGEIINQLVANKNPDAMKLYLFSFYARQSPEDPEKLYNDFMKVANYVDKRFHNAFGHGFESDRGYIFIKYGAPDDVVTVEDEHGAPPYEIWVYNELERTRENNVRFLFYNPSLAGGNFILLHSTARGEISDQAWETKLYNDNSYQPNQNELGSLGGGMGRQARSLMETF